MKNVVDGVTQSVFDFLRYLVNEQAEDGVDCSALYMLAISKLTAIGMMIEMETTGKTLTDVFDLYHKAITRELNDMGVKA